MESLVNLELRGTYSNLSFTGFHSSRALEASLSNISATTCRWLLSLRPDRIILSPVARYRFPEPVQRVSCTASICSWYLCISFTVCASFPVWYNVRTFQHPIWIVSLGERRLALSPETSVWLWSPSIIIPVSSPSLLLSSTVMKFPVSVSVARTLFMGQGRWPYAQPPTWRTSGFL